jgi:hypothetical protein
MSNPERHEMQLQRTFPSGAQEWFCPECKRWMVIHHDSVRGKVKIVVLETGDALAGHFGGTKGVVVTESQIQPGTKPPVEPNTGWLH